ncbi:unnamed protein product [Linum trigynum]|uniref:Transmembrane protein n=1 Tax=Linum trigynum TaxID=586398 RepID=A0AAV2CQ59_9ROSI
MWISIASSHSHQSFFASNAVLLASPSLPSSSRHLRISATVLCSHPPPSSHHSASPQPPRNGELGKLAIVAALTAGVLTLGCLSPDDASAAKSGGRMGGQSFRSSQQQPRSSSPRINNNSSRTNIYVNPPVAPPLVGGYGYGFGVPFYGGWGWSPFSFFAPGPSVAVGVGGGFDTFALFIFLGAAAAVVRRFARSIRDRGDEDDEY